MERNLIKKTRTRKLINLIKMWPRNTIVTTRCLLKMGYQCTDIQRYEMYGHIQRVSRGAYILEGDIIMWSGIITGLQKHMPECFYYMEHSYHKEHRITHIVMYAKNKKNLPFWFNTYITDYNKRNPGDSIVISFRYFEKLYGEVYTINICGIDILCMKENTNSETANAII